MYANIDASGTNEREREPSQIGARVREMVYEKIELMFRWV